MPDLIAEIEAALPIDEFALDKSILQQADVIYRVTRGLQKAMSQRDAAKQAVAETEARFDTTLRHQLEVSGGKVREGDIESRKLLASEVRAAKQLHLSLADEVGRWQALKDAFTQRSYMINAMIDLYVAGYFADRSQGSSAAQSVRAGAIRAAQTEMRRTRQP